MNRRSFLKLLSAVPAIAAYMQGNPGDQTLTPEMEQSLESSFWDFQFQQTMNALAQEVPQYLAAADIKKNGKGVIAYPSPEEIPYLPLRMPDYLPDGSPWFEPAPSVDPEPPVKADPYNAPIFSPRPMKRPELVIQVYRDGRTAFHRRERRGENPRKGVDPVIRQRRSKERKDAKRYRFYLRTINRTWGNIDEVRELVEALVWNVYVDVGGRQVKAMLVENGSALAVLAGLGRGEYVLDFPGFAKDYAVMQAQDWMIGKMSQIGQAGLNEAGYSRPVGFGAGVAL